MLSYPEFLAALRDIRGWELRSNQIRWGRCCPLAAVANRMCNQNYTIEWLSAGHDLRMTPHDVAAIARAADGWAGFDLQVRSDLVQACGLTEGD